MRWSGRGLVNLFRSLRIYINEVSKPGLNARPEMVVRQMAYYDYYCDKCEKKFEIQASMSDDRKWVKCPDCKSRKVRQLFDGVYIPPKTKAGKSAGGASSDSSCTSCSSGTCSTCGI